MLKNKSILSILILFCLVGFVSANGLFVNGTINTTKNYGQDATVQLFIENQENFDFYNIQFEDTSKVQITSFNLSSGQNRTITTTIKANDNFEGQLKLRGYYTTNVGASNKTENVSIHYTNGILPCNLDIIKGDKIKWNNQVADDIRLINAKTNQEITTLLEGSNYEKTFNYAEEFDYYATRIGLQFTPTCRINVMDDSGLVHNSIYDYKINTSIKVIYPNTTLSLSLLKTNYTVNYSASGEGILAVENTGSNIAKDIRLSGQWITFKENGEIINTFSLNAGQSKTLEFSINPLLIYTNQTNKSYNIIINAEGNFQKSSKEIYVFIPYAVISNPFSNGTFDMEMIRNFFKYFCSINPEDELCVKSIGNSSYGSTTVTFSADTIKQLIEKLVQLEDEKSQLAKSLLEVSMNSTSSVQNQTIVLNNVSDRLTKVEEQSDKISASLITFIIFLLFISGGIMLYYLIVKKGGKDKIKSQFNFHKGERL